MAIFRDFGATGIVAELMLVPRMAVGEGEDVRGKDALSRRVT